MKLLKLIIGIFVVCVFFVVGWIFCSFLGNGIFGLFGNCIRFWGVFFLFLWRFKGLMKGFMFCEMGVLVIGIYIGLNGIWFFILGFSLCGFGFGIGLSVFVELLVRYF